jgi:hypothetical protein
VKINLYRQDHTIFSMSSRAVEQLQSTVITAQAGKNKKTART